METLISKLIQRSIWDFFERVKYIFNLQVAHILNAKLQNWVKDGIFELLKLYCPP